MPTDLHYTNSQAATFLHLLELSGGEKVADLGAGDGVYTRLASKLVGTNGHIYALEVMEGVQKKLYHALMEEGITNATAVWGDIERKQGTRLRDSSIDACIVADVLFQIHDKKSFLDEMMRVMKNTSRVLCVDWYDSFGGRGPEQSHIIPLEQAKGLFKARGFEIVKELLSEEQHHYAFVAARKA